MLLSACVRDPIGAVRRPGGAPRDHGRDRCAKVECQAGQYRDIQVDRSCYYVLPLGDKWAMKLKGSERTWEFTTQAEALAVAREAAQSVWRDKGMHSVVLIQQPDGQWLQDAKQGETPMPPSRSSK